MNAPETVAGQNATIQESLKDVSIVAESYAQISTKNAGQNGMQETGEVGEARMALVLEAWKPLRAIRGPVDTLFERFEKVIDLAHTIECLGRLYGH